MCVCTHTNIYIYICKYEIILEFLRGEGQKFKATALSHAGRPHCSRAATWSCPIWRPHGTARTIHIPLWPVTHADLHPGEVAISLPWTPTAPRPGWGELFFLRGGGLPTFLLLRGISSHPIFAPPGDRLWRIFAPPGKYLFPMFRGKLPLAAGESHDARNTNTSHRWAGQKPQYFRPGEPGCSVLSQNMGNCLWPNSHNGGVPMALYQHDTLILP